MPLLPFPVLRRVWLVPVVLTLGLMLMTCRSPASAADTTTAVPLDPDHPAATRIGALEYRGGLQLPSGIHHLGGLSGLAILDQGRRFYALSDHGYLVTGRLGYDAAGRLASATISEIRTLRDVDGRGLRGLRRDSEGLTALPDGSWVVSFEHAHRLMRYPAALTRPDARPVELPPPPGLDQAPANGGIEAITAFPDGRLLALEEGDDDGSIEHRAWFGNGKTGWATLTYRSARNFRPTDATRLADDSVLVLERRFTWLGGFAARVVRLAPGVLRPGATLEGEELMRLEPPLTVDNFEGIAARPGAGGETLIYLVSDDNFRTEQRTLLLMFAYRR